MRKILLLCLLLNGLQSGAQDMITILRRGGTHPPPTVMLCRSGTIIGLQLPVPKVDVHPMELMRESSANVQISCSSPARKIRPMVVLDGKKTDDKAFEQLDPNAIAEIKVVKGSTALLLFGFPAADGVILIKTKRSHCILIKDTAGNPLPKASVIIRSDRDTSILASDDNGWVGLPKGKGNLNVIVSCVGYNTVERKFEQKERESSVTIQLSPRVKIMEPVTINAFSSQRRCCRMGCKATRVKKAEELTVNPPQQNKSIYPNPAPSGSNIFIPVLFSGKVKLTFFNIAGQVLASQDEEAADGIVSVRLPYTAPGSYIVVAAPVKGGPSIVNKLIIQ